MKFKSLLILLTLQFCVHRGELACSVKVLDNETLETELLCPHKHSYSGVPIVFDNFKQSLEERVGNREAIKDWKNEDQRNWVSCFLIHTASASITETIEILEYLIPIMGNRLWDKDIYGCNFMHYLIPFTASLKENDAEKQVLKTLQELLVEDIKDFDCKDNYGVTQLLLAEMLNMKKLAKFIKTSNKQEIYGDHKDLMKQTKNRLRSVFRNEEQAKEEVWRPVDSFLFLLNEIINKENPDGSLDSLDLVAYSTVFLDINLKNILYNTLVRRRIVGGCFIPWWGHIKLYLSESEDKDVVDQASRDGCPSVVKALIDQGLDVKSWPSLSGACIMKDDTGIIQILLDAGAEVDAETEVLGSMRTALYFAAINGHANAVDMLLDAGADINAPCAPVLASLDGYPKHMDIFHKLIARGASVETPGLILALIRKEEQDVAVDMIARAAIVDGLCLYRSIQKGSYKVAEAILKKGIETNGLYTTTAGLEKKGTPLHAAVCARKVELVKLLLEAGADPNFYSNLSCAPLYQVKWLMQYCNDDKVEMSKFKKIEKMLLAAGATYNKPDKDGVLPLHKAAQSKDYSMDHVIESILDGSGADVDLLDANGKTAFYYAAENGNNASLLFLLKRKADPAIAIRVGLDVTALSGRGGRSLIHVLADVGYFDLIFKMNLSKDQLNTMSRNGKTILNYAVTNEVDHKVIDKLIKAGCRLDIQEKGNSRGGAGRLVIEIPLRSRKWDMFKHLYKKMQEDPEASQLLEDKDLKAEIEKRATKDVKAFITDMQKKAANKVKGKGKKRKVDDGGDGPAQKKQVVTKSKKRQADDDNNGAKMAKKSKVVQTRKKGKGKKQ